VQCGFCTPGFIVSAYVLLKQNPNPTRQEVRQWFYDHHNLCRCTGYKPIVDSVMAAAAVVRGEKTMEDITFKAPENGEYYGSALPRPGALSRVTGLCDFGDDIMLKMPKGTLEVAIVQPRKYHHAKILNIDTSEAEKMPGVYKVITAQDLYARGGTNKIAWKMTHKRNRGTGEMRPILADKKVLRYGDVVALVCADTREHAREAAAAVKVDLEQLPEYTSALEAVMPDAMQIHENVPNIYEVQPLFKDETPGDTREILANSKYVVEGSFYTQREPHLSIEGDILQDCIARTPHRTGQCRRPSQRKERDRPLQLPYEGYRSSEHEPLRASLAWSTSSGSMPRLQPARRDFDAQQPLMSYLEHLHYIGKRAPAFFNARMGCDENGKITA
jgi:aldehyde oxidoreductase